jgi:hypothetical protein
MVFLQDKLPDIRRTNYLSIFVFNLGQFWIYWIRIRMQGPKLN